MKLNLKLFFSIILLGIFISCDKKAQSDPENKEETPKKAEETATDTLGFYNTSLPVEERVKDLISRLTLEEKADQMMHNTSAIERLGIPPYSYWNEALHGVGRSGIATVFPQAIGLGATLDRKSVV